MFVIEQRSFVFVTDRKSEVWKLWMERFRKRKGPMSMECVLFVERARARCETLTVEHGGESRCVRISGYTVQ